MVAFHVRRKIEEAFIGACLLKVDFIPKNMFGLEDKHFYSYLNRNSFNAIKNLLLNDSPVDSLLVLNELQNIDPEVHHSDENLAIMGATVPSATYAEAYAKAIIQNAEKSGFYCQSKEDFMKNKES